MIRVKICGITNAADARAAFECGADAIGIVFVRKSPRCVGRLAAQKIIRSLPPWAPVVGVFADRPPGEILLIARALGLNAVQLHGQERPRDLELLKPLRRIKTIRVADTGDLRAVRAYRPDAFLFDAKVSGALGGTGRTFEWSLLKGLGLRVPMIIAGGLEPGNVAQAARALRPYGVETSSGVEKRAGVKDKRLMKEFIRNAKNA